MEINDRNVAPCPICGKIPSLEIVETPNYVDYIIACSGRKHILKKSKPHLHTFYRNSSLHPYNRENITETIKLWNWIVYCWYDNKRLFIKKAFKIE